MNLVSIIVPIYKTEKYLNKCIDSIVNQTYKDLEIILVDDGSPDRCPQMCDAWEKKDNRVRVIHQHNVGVSAARNSGIQAAQGDFITFVDSDDWIELDTIEKMIFSINTYSADIVSCGFIYEHADSDHSVFIPEKNIYEGKDVAQNLLLNRIRPEVCSKLYLTSVLKDIKFDEDIKYAEDLLFNFYVMINTKKLVNLNYAPYHYMQESGCSSTSDYITNNRAQSWKVFRFIMCKCMNDNEIKRAAVYRFTVYTFGVLNRVMSVKEFSKIYFDEISNELLKYKKAILTNELIDKKHKRALQLLGFNKKLYKMIFSLYNKL